MTPQDVYTQLQKNSASVLLDVREPNEYAEVHVDGSVLCPSSAFDQHIVTHKFAKDAPLYVLCRSGGRSQTATDKLKKLGYTDVHNIEGGILKWIASGLPHIIQQ